MAPVCKFWQQGSCRFGDSCRFEHPPSGNYNNSNRFGALSNTNSNTNTRSNNAYQSGSPSSSQALPYQLDKNAIITDLTSEKPQWILSAYGPGRFCPAQLFGGAPREQSFEEMRLLHYQTIAAGNPQQAVQQAEALQKQSEEQIQTSVNNIDQAIQWMINAENEHPNRIDIVKRGQAEPNPLSVPTTSGGAPQTATTFGAPSQPASTPFGAIAPASAFGAPSQPAMTPAFGAPSMPGTFGQASQLGQKPSPFGAPAFGTPASAPAFGAPTQIGTFGQASQLGQKPSPFGTASAAPAFGTPAFGQPTTTPSPFGAPSQLAGTNSFGVAAQIPASNPFSAPPQTAQFNPFGGSPQAAPFGAPSQPAFGTISQPAQANPFNSAPGAFGQPSVPANANAFGGAPPSFDTTAPAANNTFGAPSAPATSTLFGQPSTAGPPASNPFGAPTGPSSFASRPPPTGPSGFNNRAANQTNGTASAPSADVSSYIKRDENGRLVSFNNQRVVYKEDVPGFTNNYGKWEKIWFPNGPPTHDPQAYLPEDRYNDATKGAYAFAQQHGGFKDGIIPLMPPLMESCRWNF